MEDEFIAFTYGPVSYAMDGKVAVFLKKKHSLLLSRR